jgi:hypothetical protein
MILKEYLLCIFEFCLKKGDFELKSVGEVLKLCSEEDFGVFFVGFGKSDDLCVVKEMCLKLRFHSFEKVFSLEFK